jgi:deoxycytidylate deaminase
MQNSTKFNNILPRLIQEASKSTINQQLSAVIIKGQKMLSSPCTNIERNTCRGHTCGSLHAEANALIQFFGKELSYIPNTGWRKERKEKPCKQKNEIRFDCYSCESRWQLA